MTKKVKEVEIETEESPCEHSEYVEAYFYDDIDPVIVMRCADCSQIRVIIGDTPNYDE